MLRASILGAHAVSRAMIFSVAECAEYIVGPSYIMGTLRHLCFREGSEIAAAEESKEQLSVPFMIGSCTIMQRCRYGNRLLSLLLTYLAAVSNILKRTICEGALCKRLICHFHGVSHNHMTCANKSNNSATPSFISTSKGLEGLVEGVARESAATPCC